MCRLLIDHCDVNGVEPLLAPLRLHLYHYFYSLHLLISHLQLTHCDIKKSGGYRSRTDDPLRARQMLWPAELTPQFSRKS